MEQVESPAFTPVDITLIAISSLVFFYLTWLPLELQTQAILSWGLVAILVIARRFKVEHRPLGRLTLIIIVLFVSSRYLIWRTTGTLVYTSFLEFILVALVYISEVQVTVVHLIGIFANIWPLNRYRAPRLPKDPALLPTIDVYIPTYNEPEEMVQTTAMACLALDYPKDKIKIYILDDGGTEAKRRDPVQGGPAHFRKRNLETFCEQNGMYYLTREANFNAKAGNINSALMQTDGELILMLDCDHIPTSDFLQHTVGFFIRDPKLFLVQTPHFFVNPDPVEKSMGTFQQAPSENEMFYRATMPGVDMWNSGFFCGSAGIIKKEYLMEANGFSGQTITEDAEMSIQLHAMGYRSVYLKKPMISGLSPETFADFILQRSRWCQGMLQMGLINNPMFVKGLSWRQKMCYTSYYLYWFFGFARVMFFIGPSLFLLFDLQIYHASTTLVMAYALPHLFASLIAADILYGKFRWPLFSELYESVQSLFLFKAVVSVIGNPRSPTFSVTPKGRHLDHDVLSPLSGPFYLLFFVMVISIPAAVYKYNNFPLLQDVVILCCVWLSINIIMAMASIGAFWERHQFRQHHRAWAKGPVTIKWGDNKSLEGELTDLSLRGLGFNIGLTKELADRQDVTVHIRDSYGREYSVPATVVRLFSRGDKLSVGLQFHENQKNFVQRIAIVYGDSQRLLDFWQRPAGRPSVAKIIYFFIKLGARGAKESSKGMYITARYYALGLFDFVLRTMRLKKDVQ